MYKNNGCHSGGPGGNSFQILVTKIFRLFLYWLIQINYISSYLIRNNVDIKSSKAGL